MIPNNIEDNIEKENLNPKGLSQKKVSSVFVPPTLEEVEAYVLEKGYHIDPVAFFYYYDANGWYQGKKKLKSWKSAAAYWERNRKQSPEEIQKKKEEEDLKRYAQWEKEANDRKRLSETQEYNSEFL